MARCVPGCSHREQRCRGAAGRGGGVQWQGKCWGPHSCHRRGAHERHHRGHDPEVVHRRAWHCDRPQDPGRAHTRGGRPARAPVLQANQPPRVGPAPLTPLPRGAGALREADPAAARRHPDGGDREARGGARWDRRGARQRRAWQRGCGQAHRRRRGVLLQAQRPLRRGPPQGALPRPPPARGPSRSPAGVQGAPGPRQPARPAP